MNPVNLGAPANREANSKNAIRNVKGKVVVAAVVAVNREVAAVSKVAAAVSKAAAGKVAGVSKAAASKGEDNLIIRLTGGGRRLAPFPPLRMRNAI